MINYSLEFHKDIESDYLDAYTWYEEAKEGPW